MHLINVAMTYHLLCVDPSLRYFALLVSTAIGSTYGRDKTNYAGVVSRLRSSCPGKCATTTLFRTYVSFRMQHCVCDG